jgi:hypothetical protein
MVDNVSSVFGKDVELFLTRGLENILEWTSHSQHKDLRTECEAVLGMEMIEKLWFLFLFVCFWVGKTNYHLTAYSIVMVRQLNTPQNHTPSAANIIVKCLSRACNTTVKAVVCTALDCLQVIHDLTLFCSLNFSNNRK